VLALIPHVGELELGMTEPEYEDALLRIEGLIDKYDLTQAELNELNGIADDVEAYEDEHYPMGRSKHESD